MAEESKPSQVAVTGAINLLQSFRGPDLTRTIGQIEKSLKGVASDSYAEVLTTSGAEKYLYVVGTEHGEKFFNGGRALSSVLRNATLRNKFNSKFGDRYRTVRDYYLPRKGLVVIQDVSRFVPELVAAAVEAAEEE
jgi:hypothetical protein